MSSYLNSKDLELYLAEDEDDENWEDFYEELEESDKLKRMKRQTKMRVYEGYSEDE